MRAWNTPLLALWAAASLAPTAAVTGVPAPAGAQEVRRPHLADHTFLSTDIVPDAFVTTFVNSSLGYAQALDLEYPPLILNGDTLVTLQGDLVYALLDLQYQHAVKDWIAVQVAAGLRGRLGTQATSLVYDGVTVSGGIDFGWLVRLHESEKTMLCGSLGVSRRSFTLVDLEQFVEDVIAGAPDPEIIDNVPVVRSRGGAHFAWAASRPFGVTLLAEGSYGETPWRSHADGWEYTFGASVDFDAGPVWGIPVGAALAYRQASLPELSSSTPEVARTMVLRLAYNARPDFIVGIDIMSAYTHEELRPETITVGGLKMVMRYYF